MGNVAVDYSRLTVRYWLTVDDDTPFSTGIEKADLGKTLVTSQVKTTSPVGGADRYVELSFGGRLGQLQPLSGTGEVVAKLEKDKDGRFNLLNDYSYLAGKDPQENSRITVYLDGVRVYGSEPTGSARQAASEETPLRVVVLGNPVLDAQVWVEVQGVKGQAVQLRVADERGYEVSQQSGLSETGADRFRVLLGTQGGGYYLWVSTQNQHQTVKIIKQ